MVGKRRLSKTTLAIRAATRVPVMLQPGAILEVRTTPNEGHRMMEVVWDGEPTLMFVQDVLERSEPIDTD